ncbi:aminoglycoside phosphotransferase family protein, partial [Candidatus Falkowbacteria bacterium]|nr:aminoglycoside phosphotransferase family protein [Candidatus Falkowbacteria bacterium]
MNQINLEVFSKLVSQKIGEEVVFSHMEKIGSGYHSDGFKLVATDGRMFFVKYVRSHDLGFEFPERQIMSLLVSNGMAQRAGNNPKAIGVVVMNGEDGAILPDVSNFTKVYHVQEFAGTGVSYSELLKKNSSKKTVDDEDRKQLSLIADALIKIHSVKHPSNDASRLKAVYDDGLRNMLSNPELFLMVLSEFPEDYAVLDLEGQKEIISLVYENIKACMGCHVRLSALHGDFWGANIFFKDDGDIFIIDYSRIPWGDPGIDVGWFIAEYLWQYHLTGNSYFKELIELWLEIYEQKSGDKEIRKHMPLVIAWTGIVQV